MVIALGFLARRVISPVHSKRGWRRTFREGYRMGSFKGVYDGQVSYDFRNQVSWFGV